MSQIDWSKAPEGAEFWGPATYLFYREVNGEFQKFSETRERWMVAAAERYKYAGLITRPIVQPVAWTGEGPPPVGTVCEYMFDDAKGLYTQATIVAHDNELVVFKRKDRIGYYGASHEEIGDMPIFRPIRTPEQIAAEERHQALLEMVRIEPALTTCMAGKLYDAGYRKQADK